jgi:hypothetical protein
MDHKKLRNGAPDNTDSKTKIPGNSGFAARLGPTLCSPVGGRILAQHRDLIADFGLR